MQGHPSKPLFKASAPSILAALMLGKLTNVGRLVVNLVLAQFKPYRPVNLDWMDTKNPCSVLHGNFLTRNKT
jgi:hypothetical protein